MIEIKTLVQDVYEGNSSIKGNLPEIDTELATLLNDRWEIIPSLCSITTINVDGATQHTRIITLQRDKQDLTRLPGQSYYEAAIDQFSDALHTARSDANLSTKLSLAIQSWQNQDFILWDVAKVILNDSETEVIHPQLFNLASIYMKEWSAL